MRYINADALRDYVSSISSHYLCEWDTLGVMAAIDRQPTADVAPVIHAQWEYSGNGFKHLCTNCKKGIEGRVYNPPKSYRHCPNCGAKMDGGKNDAKI